MISEQAIKNIPGFISDLQKMTQTIYLACDAEVAADVCLKTNKSIKLINDLLEERNNDYLESVLKKSYKYALGNIEVGTHEITDDLSNALCNVIGDKAFQEWCDTL